jgi:carboxypeptidase Q
MKRLTVFCLACAIAFALPATAQPRPTTAAVTPAQREAVKRIIGAAITDEKGWERLSWLTDHIGHRLSGSPQLERAIAWAVEELKRDGFENVRAEKVMVPHWVRGEESAELLEPSVRSLTMLGLGNSVGTPPEGIEADVLVVGSFDELKTRANEVKGKIVLFNVPFTSYGETVQYRSRGVIEAAKLGGVAALVRSVGPVSLNTPHTGALRYDEKVAKIPGAALTIEAAETLARMQARGDRIRMRLKMEAKMLPDAESANVVAELRGSEKPEEIVLVSGHFDSWDVGQGAHDDGGACMAAWHAVRVLKELGLRPKRTIRVVLWTNEENGLAGGRAYREQHKSELPNHVLAIEADSGIFRPLGYGFTGSPAARAAFADVLSLLEPIGADKIGGEGGGADISPIMADGVFGAGLTVAGDRYFHYHHTNADTLDKIDPHDFALCVATLAVTTYVVADLPTRLGR